ncbi:shikimate kinase [Thalassococcus profundi]|uniref:Shikimate kinase n=1 Tax=Thalassococcus profundi TaxID=2282382 RepID=A0A369TNA9_9RHOB|nr:shikimate kinase [Thalassococcus profundi]RDD66781.1 shikimate kinase [Thalassococcus profundi]
MAADGRSAREMQAQLKKTVVLVGMMGAGKTAVGKALAQVLSVPFRDSDSAIEEAANMSIAEIFARDGEPFFRRKESQVIERLLEAPPSVLSTGGGAYMSADNRKLITGKGIAVWLDVELPLLWSRVRHKDTRPLLRTPDPHATLRELYAARVPVYARADVTVKARPHFSVEDMAVKVRNALLERPDVLEKIE